MPAGDAGAGLFALCCVFLIIIPIALAVGAVILRSACHIVGVRVPEFGRAMGIVFLAGLIGAVISFGLNLVVAMALGVDAMSTAGRPALADKQGVQMAQLISSLIGLPIQALVSAGIYSAMLDDCSFGRGLLVWLVQLLISILIAVFIVAIAFGLLFLLGSGLA